MATAVFIPPSPHDPLARMATSSRRAPLANISNATNSPHRPLTNSGSKRSRAIANLAQQENEPPLKRQAVERRDGPPVTPRRRPQPAPAEGKEFERGNGRSGMTTLQKQFEAVRERDGASQAKTSRSTQRSTKDIENIRQWQKHYRKMFPTYNFYFDSVSDEHHARFVRHLNHFGSSEEKFFSKNVTHIITTRPIPSETATPKQSTSTSPTEATSLDEQSQTINPSLLERTSTTRSLGQNSTAVRRDAPMDILSRGQQMGMKIWAAEKLQRVLSTMLEDPTQTRQNRGVQDTHMGRNKDDLSQVLRNEKLGATAEREQISMPREIIAFRGPFIYVHDMDEKVRPTMIREYAKPLRRQDGEWPQFRSSGNGKCPFVEDSGLRKEEQGRVRQKAVLLQQQTERQHATRAQTVVKPADAEMEPPKKVSPRKALHEVCNPAGPVQSQRDEPTPMPGKLERQSSFPSMPEQPPLSFLRPAQMHLIREPAASGIQRSNMTSAIQSQMISSTAATGIKAGTSKEVHELKRKVLERGHTASLSIGSIPSSHRMTDISGALKNARAPAPQRAAKSKAQEKLGGIQEEDQHVDDMAAERVSGVAAKKKKVAKREPKPGYCENCRDKYDDFEEHIVSRKHRKFAMTQSNWDDLDALLRKLQAP